MPPELAAHERARLVAVEKVALPEHGGGIEVDEGEVGVGPDLDTALMRKAPPRRIRS